jgi:hypothetical protein
VDGCKTPAVRDVNKTKQNIPNLLQNVRILKVSFLITIFLRVVNIHIFGYSFQQTTKMKKKSKKFQPTHKKRSKHISTQLHLKRLALKIERVKF